MTTDAGRFPKQKQAPRPLPPGWRWVRLGELLTTVETGRRPRGGSIGVASGVPSLSAEHITRFGTFDFSTLRFVPHDFYEKMTRGRIQVGDILIVKDGATTGKTAFVDESFPFSEAVVNEHVFLCRPDSTIVIPRFLFFWLHSPIGQRAIKSIYKGSTIGGINQDFVDSLWVLYPPLSEQRRIVDMLVMQISSVQKMREAAQRQLLAARQLRFSIISQYMEVYTSPYGILLDILSSPPATGWPHAYGNKASGTPFLTLSAVLDFEYDSSQVKFTDLPADEEADYWAKPGDIFMSRSNTPELVGHAAIYNGVPERVIFPDLLIRLSVNNHRADLRFVHYWLMSPTVRSYISSNARGSSGTMKKITLELVRKIPFPSNLSLEQQVRIANAIEEKMVYVRSVLGAVERQMDAIDVLLGAFMNELLGEFGLPSCAE